MESAGPYVITLSAQKPKILSLVPNDPTSRYKTRQLQVQVVGKSKMIKTMLVNILDVAKDMQVPPSYIGTFMGYEIGAQAKWDAGKPERQQAYITGEHDTKDLSGILLKFLTEVVLCPVCGLPELLINFEIKNKVAGKCRACGNNSELPITSEKFRKYIIKNPPSGNTKGEKAAFAGNKAAAAAAAANSKKESKKESSKSSKTKREAKKKGAESDEDEDEDGVIWFSDTSAEAARKRQEEMVPKSIEEKQIEMEVEEVAKLLKESTAANLADRLKQIKATHNKAFYSRVFSALFGSATDLQAEAKTNLNILKAVVTSPEAQLALLSFLETLAGTQNVALASKIALVLKDLYDNDLIEEEQILKWDSSEMNPVIKEKAAPFIKWLKEAEEESEEEEEEDSDE